MDGHSNAITGYPSIDKPWLKYYSEEALSKEPFCGSVYNHIYESNKNHPNDIALVYFGRKIQYRELFSEIEKVQAAFVKSGVKKGDNVVLLMTSCPELVYIVLALNRIGAVANMINPLFTKEQIVGRVNDTQAEVMIVLDQLFGCLDGIRNQLVCTKTVVIKIEQSMPFYVKAVAHHKLNKNIRFDSIMCSWKEFISSGKGICNLTAVNDPELPAIMVYSSGTTGASKGIVLMNKGINATIAHYEYSDFSYSREDTNLQIVPTWFSTGIVFCLLMPLCLGFTSILEPVFSEENFFKDLAKYKPNLITGANSLWLHAIKNIIEKKMDVSFLKYPVSGGEKTLYETEVWINDILREHGCKSKMLTGYGMCELGSTASTATAQYHKYGSCGYPILGVTVAAFDPDTNAELKYGERGEIRVNTRSRMKEYYRCPEATEEFFYTDSNGTEWGCTGDIGFVDENGYVYVLGRINDLIRIAQNEKIYGFDVEEIVQKCKDVDQSEAVGIDGEDGYERVFVFLLMKENSVANENDIKKEVMNLCKNNLNTNCVPAGIQIIEKFPIKPSGKRDMEALRRMALEQAGAEQVL